MISTLRTENGVHYLTAELDGSVNATRTDADLGAWQDWDVLPDIWGDAGVRLLRSAHGKYLSAYDAAYCVQIGVPPDTVAATAEYPDSWERWRVAIDGDVVRLQSCSTGLWLSPQNVPPAPQAGGGDVLCNGPQPAGWETLFASDMSAFGAAEPIRPPTGGGGGGPIGPPGVGVVRPLQGPIRAIGRSFGDGSGPRVVHGCSDFPALAKYHEDPDTYLRNLDVTAQWQQYTRIAWRLNGWVFDPRGLSVDPYKHDWWEAALRGVLQAHRDRGVRASVSSFDMNHWTDRQAMDAFQRTATICRDYGDTVIFSAVTNEMQGTWEPGETDENVARGHELMQAWIRIFPGGLQAISDPHDRSREGMKKLAVTLALIHQFGNPIDTGIRRAFNDINENYPGHPVVQDEPRGPNGPQGGDVTGNIENPHHLFALYTMHVIVGCASTYFNNPGCASRLPLDSTWGFKELPRLWRDLEIPDDIGQGQLCPGHHDTFMQVRDSHAARADGMRIGGFGLGVISGSWDGQPWAVRAGYDATWSVWYADGRQWEGRLSAGQVIPTMASRGFTPAVVRAV